MTTNKPEEAMTDRGLLELAAKAAGYNAFPGHAAQMMDSGWNPLTDDGDALRLAVDLRIDVYPWISEEDPTSSAMARNGHGFRAIELYPRTEAAGTPPPAAPLSAPLPRSGGPCNDSQ